MRRLTLVAVLSLVALLVYAPAALAQNPSAYNCDTFDIQRAAQVFFDTNNPSQDPYLLDADGDGAACEGLPKENEDSGSQDIDCGGPQQQAQATLEADPSDPNNLDADNDGVACEVIEASSTPTSETTLYEDGIGVSGISDVVPTPAQDKVAGSSAEEAPAPPPYEVNPNGDIVFGGDAILANGCEEVAVSSSEDFPNLTDTQFQDVSAQCEELGSSTPAGEQYAEDDATDGVASLPDTGGPMLLMPIAGLAVVIGIGGLLLGRRLS